MADATILVEIAGDASSLEKATNQAQSSLNQAFSNMQKSGAVMSAAITAPLVAVGTTAIKTSVDFESAFAGVIKTVDATEEELAQLRQGILDMSNELPASANEIAKVAEAAGQLGIQTENILSFTRTMIDLGESTNLSAEQAATALARFANIVQMPQDEFDKLGSVIVDLGNNLATTEAEIVEMGLRLAGAGEQVGMTEAQIMSIAGALSSVGIRAEAGGSAFSRLMVEMQLAVETGEGSLEDFADVAGMTSEEFQQAFQEDAANAILAFIEGLSRAEERGESAIKILDDMEIKEIRLRDALLRAAGASDVFRESLEIGTKAWEENTALTTEASKRYETTASQFEMVKNQVAELGIKLGETLLPIIKDTFIPLLEKLVDRISGLIDWFNNLSPVAQGFFEAFGAAAAAGGPILLMVGSVGKAVESFKLLGSLFSGAGILGPTGLVIAGVALVATLIISHWDEISAFLTKCWEGIKNVATTVWNNITDFFTSLWDGLKETWNSNWETIGNAMVKAWEGISTTASSVWEGTKGFFTNLWDGLSDTWTSAWEGIGSALNKTWSTIKTGATNLWDTITGKSKEGAKEVEEAVQESCDKQEKSWKGLSLNLVGHSIIPEMVSSINEEFQKIDFKSVEKGLESLELKFEETAEGIKNSAKKAADNINSFLGVIGDIGNVAIGAQFGEKPTAGKIGGIFTGILGLFSGIPTWIGNFFNMVFGWLGQVQQKTQAIIDGIASQLQSGIIEALSQETWGEAVNVFSQTLHDFVFSYVVEALVKALLATELFQDAIKNFAQQIDYAIKQSFVDGVFNPEIFRELSRPAVEGLGKFWTETGLKALEVIWDEAKSLGSYLSSLSSISISSSTSSVGGAVNQTSAALLQGTSNCIQYANGLKQCYIQGKTVAEYAQATGTTIEELAKSMGGTVSQANSYSVAMSSCSSSSKKASKSVGNLASSVAEVKKEISEVNNLLSAFSSLLGNVFSATTWGAALNILKNSLYQGLYETVVKSITNGLLAASAFKTPIETLGKAINKATNEAFKGGVFNPDKFKSIFDPALKTFKNWFENTGTKAVKTIYDYLNDLFGTLMGSRYSLNYATVDIAGVISVPSYQKGGYVSETGLAYLHKGEYVNPSGKENITVNQTFISPKPLNERESRRQMERGMRIMSLELGLA